MSNTGTCLHQHTRPSADDWLDICTVCGRIVRALTHEGGLGLLRLAAKWRTEDARGCDGSLDYTIKVPVPRPQVRRARRTEPSVGSALPTRPAWSGVRVEP